MAVTDYKISHPFGIVESEGIDLIKFQEKPIWRTNVNAGIYVLDKSVIKLIKHREVVSMPEIFKRFQMNSLLKLWSQPSWIKWIVYLAIVYVLFLIKEAFAIVLWFLFCIILYYIIFANNIFKTRTYYEKNNF